MAVKARLPLAAQVSGGGPDADCLRGEHSARDVPEPVGPPPVPLPPRERLLRAVAAPAGPLPPQHIPGQAVLTLNLERGVRAVQPRSSCGVQRLMALLLGYAAPARPLEVRVMSYQQREDCGASRCAADRAPCDLLQRRAATSRRYLPDAAMSQEYSGGLTAQRLIDHPAL